MERRGERETSVYLSSCICVAVVSHASGGRLNSFGSAPRFGWLTLMPVDVSQPVVHYGFIPTIILLGMTQTDPAPQLVSLLSPV